MPIQSRCLESCNPVCCSHAGYFHASTIYVLAWQGDKAGHHSLPIIPQRSKPNTVHHHAFTIFMLALQGDKADHHSLAPTIIAHQGDEVDQAITMYKKAKQWDPMIRLVAQHRKDNLAQHSEDNRSLWWLGCNYGLWLVVGPHYPFGHSAQGQSCAVRLHNLFGWPAP
eukprot:1152272-Pelagomonas_calceolata.AAC.13